MTYNWRIYFKLGCQNYLLSNYTCEHVHVYTYISLVYPILYIQIFYNCKSGSKDQKHKLEYNVIIVQLQCSSCASSKPKRWAKKCYYVRGIGIFEGKTINENVNVLGTGNSNTWSKTKRNATQGRREIMDWCCERVISCLLSEMFTKPFVRKPFRSNEWI